MIKSFTVINHLGEELKMELRKPEATGFLIASVTGLEPVKADICVTDISTGDGSTYNFSRMGTRNIVFQIIFQQTPENESIEDLRHKSYKYFPLKKKIELIIETDDRHLSTTGYVESNDVVIFSSLEGTTISIICPDPYFYGYGDEQINRLDFYGNKMMFEFPFSNESLYTPLLEFGSINTVAYGVINYTGDKEVGVMIYIHAIGLIENLAIYNVDTHESIKIDTNKLAEMVGEGFIAGDDIIINTMQGEKGIVLVREGITYNILNCLDKNTDWFVLSNGDNVFAYTAENGLVNVQLRMENKTVYEGA